MALIFGMSVSKAQYLFRILVLGLLIILTALHYCPRYRFALLIQWSNCMHYFCQNYATLFPYICTFVYKFQHGLSATCPCSPGLTCAVTGIDHGKKKRIFQCISVGTYQETEGLEEELSEKVATAKPWASLSSLSFFGLLSLDYNCNYYYCCCYYYSIYFLIHIRIKRDFLRHKTVKTNDKTRRFGVVMTTLSRKMFLIMQITAFKAMWREN